MSPAARDRLTTALSASSRSGVLPPRVRRRLRDYAWKARFLGAALLAGLAATVVVHHVAPERPPSVAMVVLADEVDAGTTLTAQHLRVVDAPAGLLPADGLQDVEEAVGRTVALRSAAGSIVSETLLSADVAAQAPLGTVIAAVRLADPALVTILGPGMRVDLLSPDAPGAASTGVEIAGQTAPAGHLARGALVLPYPRTGEQPAAPSLIGSPLASGEPGSDLILVAVTPAEAAALASMTGWGAVSAVLVR